MSRFDDLLKQRKANPDIQTFEHSDAQASEHTESKTSEHSNIQTSKGKNPAYQRTTIYIRKELHTRLKTAAIVEGVEMSEVIEGLIEQWLESKHSDV